MASVQLENVARRFESAVGVEGISLEIPDGEFWVLVGPSGCGKSTVLRLIAGLETPTAGNIYIGGQRVNDLSARQRDVAMVFQNYALYPHMSVAENLSFGLQMRGVEVAKIQERIQSVAKSLDIAHLLGRKPRQLSGGQQQRVALGRAIVRSPRVFLLDEPLSNLDAQLRDDTRAELKQLHQKIGITTIYVTHDQVEAMTLADRIVVLQRGRIQQIGTPQQIYKQPANRMVAAFLGNPPMNLLQAGCEQSGPNSEAGNVFRLSPSQTIPCPVALLPLLVNGVGHRFELGLRPEHLQVCPSELAALPVDWASLQVVVKLVEPLGRENLIRASLVDDSQQVLNLSAPATIYPQVAERLHLRFPLDELRVFDSATGNALLPG